MARSHLRRFVYKGLIAATILSSSLGIYGAQLAPQAHATTVPSPVSALSTRSDFVSYLYSCMLGKTADQSGLDFWVGNWDSSSDPVNHLYRAFYLAGDFNKSISNTDFINKMYQCVLFRQPNDPPDNNFSGRDFWASQMLSSPSNQVADDATHSCTSSNPIPNTQCWALKAFLDSSEYKTNILPVLSALPLSAEHEGSPVTISLSASNNSVAPGESVYLSWSAKNADSGTTSFDNGIGSVGASGNLLVKPTATTTYTLTGKNSLGTVTKSVTITVKAITPTATELDSRLGVVHINGAYPKKGSNFLAFGAQDAQNLGFQGIEVMMSPAMCSVNHPAYQTTDWCDSRPNPITGSQFSGINPKYHNLGELAQDPRYQSVFNQGFKNIFITAETINPDRVTPEPNDCVGAAMNRVNLYNAGSDCYKNGFSQAQLKSFHDDYYSLFATLLQQYSGTNKNFIILIGNELENHFENGGANPEWAMNNVVTLLNTASQALSDAKAANPAQGVKVYDACEFTLGYNATTNDGNVGTNYVVPRTHCDLYGWSSWDYIVNHPDDDNYVTKALDYYASKAPDSADFGNKNVFLSEFGGPEDLFNYKSDDVLHTESDVIQRLNNELNEALAWGVPYANYWALYDSCDGGSYPATKDSDCRGFWLRKPASNSSELGALADTYNQVFASRVSGSTQTTVPAPQSNLQTSLPDATNFQCQGNPTIYFYYHGMKEGYPEPSVYEAWNGRNYQGIQTVDPSFCAAVPNNGTTRLPEGTFVQVNGDQTVDRIESGTARPIASLSALHRYSASPNIVRVSRDYLSTYSSGSIIN